MDRSRPGSRWLPWWGSLTSWSRASLFGLVASALLAVGLGLFIPRQVERHMLEAQASSNRQVLNALLRTRTLSSEGGDLKELDRFVSEAIERRDLVRVKLWDRDGTVTYSDDRRLIGRSFPVSERLRAAFGGRVASEVSDLSEPENSMEREIAGRLLEFYIPVEQEGAIVAVWEVYQSLDLFERKLGRVRSAVWVSVGSGLTVLFVFLISAFGTLVATVQARRREAEERSRQLSALNERIHNSHAEQRLLMSRLVSAHEDERRHVVGEIHDGLGQDLHRILFGVRGSLRASPLETRQELRRLEGISESSIRRLRRLLEDLRPPSLEGVGLVPALRTLAERVTREDGLEVEVVQGAGIGSEPRVPVRVAAFRIVQEALRNSVRHAVARHAIVGVTQDDGVLLVSIDDDGHGFAATSVEGLGVWLMRERARALGGSLDISSGARGTSVRATLSLNDYAP